MSRLQAYSAVSESEALKRENDALKERLARLSEASLGISENPDVEASLQEVVHSTRKLTGARYGALVTLHASSEPRDHYISGGADDGGDLNTPSPLAPGLLGLLHGANSPVRLSNLATHSDVEGLPANQPPPNTFLGMPIFHRGQHVASLYIVDKEGGQEFTKEDESLAATLTAQAASIISNARRHEEAQRAREDLESLLDMSPVGVVVFDAQTAELAYINQEIRRMMSVLEFPEESMQDAFEIMSFRRPDGRELPFQELPLTRVLQSGETVGSEEILVHLPNGNEMLTLVSCGPVFAESGEILSVVTIMQDMTSLHGLGRKRAEFLEVVSEELRTPSISIKGAAIDLRSTAQLGSTAEPMQLLRIIEQQADLMRSQVNSLISLAQIETGTLSVATATEDVAELLHGSCGEFLRDHAANTIQRDIPGGLPKVLVDRQRIDQVMHNFLRQAARYSNESSPIKVSASTVDIYVVVSISVEGSTSPTTESARRYWKPETPETFKNLSRSHSKLTDLASDGEGLALAFCRGVVEAHGGRIATEVDEEAGQLTLTFTLPTIADEEEIDLPGSRELSGETSQASAEPTRILVCIEDPRMQRSVQTVLLDAGYGSVETPNLEDVEELALSERPRLILMDITGREEESFRILRGSANPLNLPAIVLCDRGDEEYVVRAFEMGADGYMVKPFSPFELIARIRATLRRLNAGGGPAGNRAFQLGDLHIDFDARTVQVSGQPVQLTVTEYKLLAEFSHSAGRVLTQDSLLQRIWGWEYAGESQLLRSYVKSLRRKIGDDARQPRYIFTERGVGYRMAKPDSTPRQPETVASSPTALR